MEKQQGKNNQLITTSKIDKLHKISLRAIILLVSIILLAIGFFAIKNTAFFIVAINFASEKCYFKNDNIFFNIIFSVCTVFFLYVANKTILSKIDEKILLIISIIFSLIIGFLWVNYIDFHPLSDQSLVIYCAESLLDDNFSSILGPGEYLNRNPHQLGFIIYIMTAFKIFNTRNPLLLQNLNVIYSVISGVLLYFICKEIFKESIVRKISLLLIPFFSIYWTFFSTHVYGNIPGLMFALCALLFTLKYLEKKDNYKLIVIALSITIAYLLKSNYQIFLCAIIIILILDSIKCRKISPIIGIIGILTFMFSFKFIIYSYIEKVTGYSLNTGVSMSAYVYMGIAEPVTLSPGWYTADVETIYNQANFDKDASKTISKNLFINRIKYLLSDLRYTFNFFNTKIKSTWINPTFQVFWCSTPSTLLDLDPAYNHHIYTKELLINMLTGKLYDLEERILDIYQIVTFISAGIGLYMSYKDDNLKKTLLPLTFLGGFIFHTIWETKAIYVIQYFYIMLPFAAFGLYKIFNKIDKSIKY